MMKQVILWVWRISYPFVRAVGLDRALWRKKASELRPVLDKGWKEQLLAVENASPFLQVAHYRPNHSLGFDSERENLAVAIAIANLHYFRGDIAAYEQSFRRAGEYLEDSAKRDGFVRESDVWAEYLHYKASLLRLGGHPSGAARENSKVVQVYRSLNRSVEADSSRRCTICCRIESLAPEESDLRHALARQADSVAAKFQHGTDSTGQLSENDRRTDEFYAQVVRCKVQVHAQVPDLSILEDAIKKAKDCQGSMHGPDMPAYRAAVPLYEAILSYHRGDLINARVHYDRALSEIDSQQIPYLCLLTLPKSVGDDLANKLGRRRILSDIVNERAGALAVRRFKGEILGAPMVAAVLSFLIVASFSLLPRSFPHGLTIQDMTPAVWMLSTLVAGFHVWRRKRRAERSLAGLIPSGLLALAEWVHYILTSIAIAMLVLLATRFI